MSAPTFFLKDLTIQNFATFKNQSIQFGRGLNALIGETGSGKSLILDALQLLLGARSDKKVVRRETEYSLLEASFECHDQKVIAWLEAEGFPCENNQITLKRMIYKNGSSRSYINHLSCSLQNLAHFARQCIDLVGQFENQKLLSEGYQLYLLDHFAKLLEEREVYHQGLNQFQSLKKKQETLLDQKLMREQRLDYLEFQLQEIDKLNPSVDEEEFLLNKKISLLNYEKHLKLAYQFLSLLDGEDESQGLLPTLRQLRSLLLKNTDFIQDKEALVNQSEDLLTELRDHLEKHINTDHDPSELEKTLERLDLYQKLKRKFGGSVEQIMQAAVDFRREKQSLQEIDIDLSEMELKIKELQIDLQSKAKALHKKRVKASVDLAKKLTERIQRLRMIGAEVQITVEELDELQEWGQSRVYFKAQTNPGEGFYRIKDIASGGELSRILLAVRQILSAYDSISIFLFDEIDTGVGGETAITIGEALNEVSHHGQVIAITHLPQIAQFADKMIIVQKEIHHEGDIIRTESSVREVLGKGMKKELQVMHGNI